MAVITSPSIEKRRYIDEDCFSAECTALETSLWHFAGLAANLECDNDFLTVSVARKSIIVQNFGGSLRAFENVCAHRFARIRCAERGNGPLRCPYHAWQYNRDGVPVGIPAADEAFGFERGDKRVYALKSWRVERCGDFIFVSSAQGTSSLKEALGGWFEKFRRLSECIGEEVDYAEYEYPANWKVCVENTIDEYHAAFVHPTTFRQVLTSSFEYQYEGACSSVVAGIRDEMRSRWKRLDQLFSPRPFQSDSYHHYLLFPLTTLATTFGATFSIQTFEPQSPDRTLLRTRIYLSRFERRPPDSVLQAFLESARAFNHTVFKEDEFVCGEVQRGLRQSSELSGILGRYEQRIAHFHENVKSLCRPRCLGPAFDGADQG